jgi:hypothetical protein
MKNEYDNQAQNFAKKFNVKLSVIGSPKYGRYFSNDKDSRYIFKLKLQRNNESYIFTFGQSIAAGSKKPTLYDVLACLTKYDPESFENFCNSYGYESTGANKYRNEYIYKNVCKEWDAVNRLFSDCLEELQEIQ